ncbi:MAG: DUF401 family protein [Firmicutes bacterium]|nr:DUF401 family protein [Bacillota bacterium]
MGFFAVIIAIGLIMYCVRRKLNMGLSMMLGALALALLAPVPLDLAWEALITALGDANTWTLTLVVVLIGVLGHLLTASGTLDLLVDKVLALSAGDSRWALTVIPMVMGALSVPGGAMMSAPLVDRLGDRGELAPEFKTGINIVFRHLWYVALPVIPSIILAAALADVTPATLAAQNLWAGLAGMVAAWWFLLRKIKGSEQPFQFHRADLALVLVSLLPLLVVLALFLIVELWFPLALVAGIICALLVLPGGQGPLAFRMLAALRKRSLTMLAPGVRPGMLLVVPGVMIFKEMLHTSSLVNTFAADLVESGIPLWLLLLVLPFALGIATGSHEATVAIALPIFVPLLPAEHYLPALGLLFGSLTIGYIISPLHLCLILTREYFCSRLGGVYRYTGPVGISMLVVILVTALLRW